MSDSPAPSETRVTVGRMHCSYTMARGTKDTQATAARLGRVVEHRVPPRCGALVDDIVPNDDAVYRINRLRLRTWIDVRGMSDEVIAGRWAAVMAVALRRELATGNTANIVRFDSPLEYVTEFIAELPTGVAWTRWWFEEFLALRSVPAGEVIVRLLAARPTWVAPALAQLARERRLLAVIELLDHRQAERLWAATAESSREPSAAVLARVAAHVRATALDLAPDVTTRRRARLLALAEIARAEPSLLAQPGVTIAVERLVDAAVLTRFRPALAARLMSAPLDDTTRRMLEAEQFDGLAVHSFADLAGAMMLGMGTLRSPVGGAALVLPALARLGFWEAWAETDETMANDYVFIVLLKVLGRRRAVLALGDHFLAAMSGCAAPPVADARRSPAVDAGPPAWSTDIPRQAGPDELAHLSLRRIGFAWLTTSLDSALSAVALAAVGATSARLGRFSGSSLEYLASVFFAQPATFAPESRTVTFDGGVLRSLLGLAGLTDEPIELPWLENPVRFEIGGRS